MVATSLRFADLWGIADYLSRERVHIFTDFKGLATFGASYFLPIGPIGHLKPSFAVLALSQHAVGLSWDLTGTHPIRFLSLTAAALDYILDG